jgi:hypothetical protein
LRTVELRKSLYEGRAVDEAIKVYDPHASLGRKEEPEHWVVTVTAKSEARERTIAGELANYALGLTVRGRGAKASRGA